MINTLDRQRGPTGTKRRRRTKGPSEKIRSLAAISLASKVGYLKLRDLGEHSEPGRVVRAFREQIVQARSKEPKTRSADTTAKSSSPPPANGGAMSNSGGTNGGDDDGGDGDGDGDGDPAVFLVALVFFVCLIVLRQVSQPPDDHSANTKAVLREELVKFVFQVSLEVVKGALTIATALFVAWLLIKWGLSPLGK